MLTQNKNPCGKQRVFVLRSLFRLFGRGGRGAAGLELLDASGGVDDLFVAGEERVALRANFHIDRFLRRADKKSGTASAGGLRRRKIFRVNVCFHMSQLPVSSGLLPVKVRNLMRSRLTGGGEKSKAPQKRRVSLAYAVTNTGLPFIEDLIKRSP